MATAAPAKPMAAGPMDVPIGYLHPGSENGLNCMVGTVGAQRAVIDLYRPTVHMEDLRETSDFTPSLDANGFAFKGDLPAVPLELKEAEADSALKKKIYNETADFMKKSTGASEVHVFSHIVRTDAFQKVTDIPKEADNMEKTGIQTTAQFSHVDQSYEGARRIIDSLGMQLPEAEAAKVRDRLTTHRWAIINAWRPISTINREPLACTDGCTVPDSDLRRSAFDTKVIRPDGKGGVAELWTAVYNPRHRWYWASNMTPSEALLIKCFDTKMDGKTCRRALHSAFQHPQDAGPGRQSCEFRCIVMWDDQEKTAMEKAHAHDNDYFTRQ